MSFDSIYTAYAIAIAYAKDLVKLVWLDCPNHLLTFFIIRRYLYVGLQTYTNLKEIKMNKLAIALLAAFSVSAFAADAAKAPAVAPAAPAAAAAAPAPAAAPAAPKAKAKPAKSKKAAKKAPAKADAKPAAAPVAAPAK